MSRNFRRKFAAAPVRAQKRRGSDTSSSSLDLSDEDEGYSAVEDISDSEDDDEDDVNAAEEENIVIEGRVGTPSIAPRPQPEVDDEDDDADDDDDDEDDEGDDNLVGDGDADETASWAGIVSEVEESQVSDFYQDAIAFASDTAVERHVRFDVPDSDSDSTESEDDHADLFPDIFVSQNALDPAFRREIENDPDESSGSGSFWDFHGQYNEQSDSEVEEVVRELSDDDTPTATPAAPQTANVVSNLAPAFEEPLELDGYESESCLA